MTNSISTQAPMNSDTSIPEEKENLANNTDDNSSQCDSEPIRRTQSLQFSSRHSLQSWTSNEDCHFLKHLSSRHSITTKRVESQPYMIYPLAAHPSDEHLPCKKKAVPSVIEPVVNYLESLDQVNQEDQPEPATSKEENNVVDGKLVESPTQQQSTGEELPLIDLISSDTTVKAQMEKARESQTPAKEQTDVEDPQGLGLLSRLWLLW